MSTNKVAQDAGQFTKGPYIVKSEGHYFKSPAVFSEDGKQLIASVYGANLEELKANARLIAAAPDLLEALQKIANWELPVTGDKWDDGSPISYEAAYGSNGVRDYIRGIASKVLKKATNS